MNMRLYHLLALLLSLSIVHALPRQNDNTYEIVEEEISEEEYRTLPAEVCYGELLLSLGNGQYTDLDRLVRVKMQQVDQMAVLLFASRLRPVSMFPL